MADIEGFEKITIANDASTGAIVLHNDNVAADKTLTIDASALVTSTRVLTVDATAEQDGKVVVIGGAGNDIITGSASTNGDNLSGNGGDDTFKFGSANLTSADTVAGGEGNDTIEITDAATVEESDFTNVTSVKTLKLAAQTNTVTLGALANAAGLSVITSATTGADAVTIGAGFTNALTVNIVTGDDNIDASASAAALTIAAAAASITTNDTLKGGTGTGDILTLTADSGTAVFHASNVTGFETINVVAATTATIGITTSDGMVAANGTLTVNAATLTNSSATLNFNGSAETTTTATVSVTGGAGADTLLGGAGKDVFIGGAGADVITGGAGADSLTGGTGNDTFIYAAVADSNTGSFDSITDWTSAADKLQVTLDYSGLVSALTINATVLTAVAGVTAAQDALSGARGQYVYDTTNAALYINVNADNLISTADFKIGLNAASTAANTVVEGDINFVIIGGSGADVITAGGGADTITGGTGADTITLGAGVDTVIQADGASVARTADNVSTNFADGDTITFGNGVDRIVSGFTAGAGGDRLDVGTAGAAITGIGVAEATMTASKTLFLSGAFVTATGVFTIAADGVGADTLIVDTTAAADRDTGHVGCVDRG